MDCDDATLMVAAGEARTLSTAEAESLHRHAEGCSDCRALLDERGDARFRWVVTIPADAFDDYDLLVLPQVDPNLFAAGPELARGGMGRVMRARDRRLGRDVAIKEVIGPGMRARFEREVMITAQLQHPAIIPVYEAGEWPNGSAFYTMRLVSGGTLGDAIAKTTTLEQRIALLPHVVALTDALAYAHSKRIVHRDLKPGNVLVGEFGETVVIDWGLAKDLGTKAGDGTSLPPLAATGGSDGGLTIAGSVMGTPGFMSPEQAEGSDVDERADVFALGAILYNLLAGHPPYLDEPVASAHALIELARERPPTPLAKLAPHAPRDLVVIVERAMARERGGRYRTAKELADELNRFSAGQLLRGRDYTTRELIARWLRRHRAAVTVAAVATAVVVIGGALSVREIASDRDEARHQLALGRLEQGRELLGAGEPAQAAPLLHEAMVGLPGDALARRLTVRAVRDADRRIAGFDGTAAAFSPDGRELAIGHRDGSLALVDSATGAVIREVAASAALPVPTALAAGDDAARVATLRYLPRTRQLVVASKLGAVVRDVDSSSGVTTDVVLLREPVRDLAVSGDSIVLATEAGEVRVVHADGTIVAHELLAGAGALDVSMDGTQLLALGTTVARAYHLPDLARVAEVPTGWWGRFDGDGGIVVADNEGVRRTLLAAPDRPIRLMRGQGQPLARFADGQLAMANELVDLEHATTHPYTTLAYPTTIAPLDRTHFITGGFDHTIRIWDRDRLALPLAVLDAVDGTSEFAVDVTATRVASIPWHGENASPANAGRAAAPHAVRRQIELWRTDALHAPVTLANLGGNEIQRIVATGPHLVVGLHPDSRAALLDDNHATIATMPGWLMTVANGTDIVMNDSGKLYRYDARTGAPRGRPIADAADIAASDLSPSGHILVTAANGIVTLRDARSTAPIGGFPTNTTDVSQVVVDDDGHAATGHDDGMLRFWNARTGAKIGEVRAHAGHVERLTIRGDVVFSESWDQTVRAWRLADGTPLGIVVANVRGVVAISGDGRLVATGGQGAEVDLWDGRGGGLLDRVPMSQVSGALAFVDDDHLLAGGRGGALELVDLSERPRSDDDLARLAGSAAR
jgi:WD40 repeat protein/tRNA A-37 threonylcarbamoyl transferase component Bud32|nr:serine/threonine-protein kinase [Kofleriaceae bacterium]